MTVAELIAALQGMDQSLPVMVWVEDAQMQDGWYQPASDPNLVGVCKRYPKLEDSPYDTPGDLSVVVIS